MANDREFLGKGLRFPVSINLNGGVSTSQLEENVRQSIFIILGTAPGERINRPQFGCQIHDLMFAPNNHLTAARAEIFCEEAIYKFEPRVSKVTCSALPNADEPNRLDIRIEYVIAGKHDKRNLVFPFYLRNEEGDPPPLAPPNPTKTPEGGAAASLAGSGANGPDGSNGTTGV